ncbi:MAG: hypothetical protein HYX92_18195 [Chloroflexi bacterium]|nr:hypothetical protein [Chloroflexota bacterium]
MRWRSSPLVDVAVAALLLVALMGFVGLFLITSGPQGQAAPAAAAGVNVSVSPSSPGNGTHFVAGEKVEVRVTLGDGSSSPLTKKDFATLNLYAYGPQEMSKTVTAVKLLNATTDRSKTPHHYIDLLTDPGVTDEGNLLKYLFQPVSDEQAGTYTVSVWAVKKGDPSGQVMALADFQLGTPVAEQQLVDKENCAACHRGAANGQFYLHHVDPDARRPFGNPSLDAVPVRTCKSCHNNEGYAAYVSPVDGSRIVDPIVNRVHGVHMGEHLKNPLNIDPEKGVFKNYLGVLFPANVKNCSACHTDDRWKTKPSRQACGACHDNTWFGDLAVKPATAKAHPGGPQANDAACATCHTPDSGGLAPVAEVHKVSQLVNKVEIGLTTPDNGAFYGAGEAPLVSIIVKDDNGDPIDHSKVDNASFSAAGLFVYGPRANTVPVLTNTARFGDSKQRALVANTRAASGEPRGWTFAAGDTFKIAVNGGAPATLTAPTGLQTPAQVRDWLASNLQGVTVTATATNVAIRSNIQGEKSRIDIYNSPVTTKMGWKPGGLRSKTGWVGSGVTQEPYVVPGRLSYPINDLRKLSDPLDYSDPAVTRYIDGITYQLDDVAGLSVGTYGVYVWIQPIGTRTPNVSRVAIGYTQFQVGTATEEKMVATNCVDCHKNTIWHLDEGPIHPAPFDTNYCKACHDYARYQTGDGFDNQGGTSLGGWSGYGGVPISRRVHGVHFGRYLEHPEQIYRNNPDIFREVIFPQDVRNCTKCHDPQTTTAAWKEEPSRLACMACHDKNVANAHAKTSTFYPNPADPWSADKEESCKVCHGPGREFAVEKMHNITNPYRPPYLREP